MIIRIDDYPHGDLINYNRLMADPLYDHREHVYHFLQSFEKRGIPYILGVSPGLIDRESDLFFLQSLRCCEVAMHGFSHGWHEYAGSWHNIAETWLKGGEFASHSKHTIREKIQHGLEILASFHVRKFIAPFNVYTQDLLDILNEFGFETIMGGRQTIQFNMNALDHGDLQLDICVPPLCNDSYHILPHLDQAIQDQKTILLHWIYEQPANVSYWEKIAEAVQRSETGHIIQSRPVDAAIPSTPLVLPSDHDSHVQSSAISPYRKELRSLPIAMVTETMNYISGGVRCIAEVLNHLVSRGYQAQCYVTMPDLRCDWLPVRFPILSAEELDRFPGILISCYSPTAERVARSNAVAKFYWVHSYEPKFPEITGRPDAWREMSEKSYRLDELQYFAASSYVKLILELIYQRNPLSLLVPGGVDTALFQPGPKGNQPLRVMFLNRENVFRGSQDIIDALQIARNQGLELDIHIMGQPIDMKDIPHTIIPPQPQLEFARLLGTANIFIHASHFEGLPLPPLEAMASQCAVISTNVGASDYLLNGYNAFVVPPKRPDKIAEALLRLAGDPALREQLGYGGYQTVINGYTWNHTVDHLEEVLIEGLTRIGRLSNIQGLDHDNTRPAVQKERAEFEAPPCTVTTLTRQGHPLVSAIISTYNSERFIRGCLEDLEAQTIASRVEIIVIDSGSQQNERAIVQEFQERYDNIVYIHTEERETVYSAWNRGIKASKGIYITSANTDDRRRHDAFERMVEILDARPDIALVYADVIITENENETFDRCTPSDYYYWLDWDRRNLLEKGSFMGPQPMWRRTLHDEYGYFDETFTTSGDYEFWLRISQTNDFFRIPVLLGLYLKSPDSVEHRNQEIKEEENKRLLAMYQNAAASGDIIRRFYTNDDGHLLNVHNRKAEELFAKGEIQAAKIILEQILSQNPHLVPAINNLGVIAFQNTHVDEAISYFTQALQIDENYFEAIENMGKCMAFKGNNPSAIEWSERALALKPNDIGLLNALGNYYIQIENLTNAKEIYSRSLKVDGSQENIRMILDEIKGFEALCKI